MSSNNIWTPPFLPIDKSQMIPLNILILPVSLDNLHNDNEVVHRGEAHTQRIVCDRIAFLT